MNYQMNDNELCDNATDIINHSLLKRLYSRNFKKILKYQRGVYNSVMRVI